jgi:hypothetical protein
MTVEAAITDAVAAAVAPLVSEIRELRATVEALRAASPPKLVTVAELVRLGFGSPATIRRRIADGSIPAIRHGRSVRGNRPTERWQCDTDVGVGSTGTVAFSV